MKISAMHLVQCSTNSRSAQHGGSSRSYRCVNLRKTQIASGQLKPSKLFISSHSESVKLIAMTSANFGGERDVPRSNDEKQIVRVHRTVKLRMDAEGLEGGKYEP